MVTSSHNILLLSDLFTSFDLIAFQFDLFRLIYFNLLSFDFIIFIFQHFFLVLHSFHFELFQLI